MVLRPKEGAVKPIMITCLLVAGAASAGQPTDSRPAGAAANPAQQGARDYASPTQPVHLLLEPQFCDSADAPVAWRDFSDPWRLASQPLAQFSADGAQFEQLRSLIEVRFTLSSLRVFVLGASAPTWGHVQLVPRTGWQLAGC
jgi:hypothetical protein